MADNAKFQLESDLEGAVFTADPFKLTSWRQIHTDYWRRDWVSKGRRRTAGYVRSFPWKKAVVWAVFGPFDDLARETGEGLDIADGKHLANKVIREILTEST